jgi:squalene-hopene/tetraprenyl-beta-curcumene cyclase
MSPGIAVEDALAASCSSSLNRGAAHLASLEKPGGYWWGDLTADTTLESDWLLMLLWLNPPVGGVWTPPDRAKVDRAVRSILARQLPCGGFSIHPAGGADVSASAKAYFALKLAGVDPASEPMAKLRARILELGGLQAANSYVKINLSLFGLYPREHVPTVPPEMILLPRNFLYEMSSWTRTIVVPLSLLQAAVAEGPRPVPAGFTMNELLAPGRPLSEQPEGWTGWRQVFLRMDRVCKWWERRGPKGIRRKAVEGCRRWLLDHLQASDGLGAIYPAMQYTVMALEALGYAPESPERAEAQRQFDRLLVDDGERFFFQPCFSPVWDTAIAAFALGEAGALDSERGRQTGDWLLSKEVRRKGDWSVKRPATEPSGWYFEFANEFYPDIDDTAMVLLALAHTRASDPAALDAATARAVRWLEAMQSSDGGWAAFDVDNNRESLSDVPFADHNAMLDPTCPDITGRVLEALCRFGHGVESSAVRRGVEYLKRAQRTEDGAWYGRWGVGYIYGTCFALRGLRAAGYDEREAEVLRAGEWLRSIQNADGGWGESCESYTQGSFVPAGSTASQTAWAVMGLVAGGDASSESVRKGVEYLIRTQHEQGGWEERLATGTGFPGVFYLTYHLYRQSFPVLALSEFLKSGRGH